MHLLGYEPTHAAQIRIERCQRVSDGIRQINADEKPLRFQGLRFREGKIPSSTKHVASVYRRLDGSLALPTNGVVTRSGSRHFPSTVLAIETRDFALSLPIRGPLLQVGAFIVRDFAGRNTKLRFEMPLLPVDTQNHKGPTLDIR